MPNIFPGERLKVTLLYSEGSPTGTNVLFCRGVAGVDRGFVVDDIEGRIEEPGKEHVPGPVLLLMHTVANVEYLDRQKHEPLPLPVAKEEPGGQFAPFHAEEVAFPPGGSEEPFPNVPERPSWMGEPSRFRDYVPEGDLPVRRVYEIGAEGRKTRIIDKRAPLAPDASAEERTIDDLRTRWLETLLPELHAMRERNGWG